MIEQVILVDEQDVEKGLMEKLEAHQKGLLHRAVSVFIFNSKGQMLLQQRAAHKYHSAGLWTNTCCSHPRPGETALAAAERRLKEEMGMQTDLDFKKSFVYRSAFENGLTEYEFDHIFTGTSDLDPILNKEEAQDYSWMTVPEIEKEIKNNPAKFTTWFMIAMKDVF